MNRPINNSRGGLQCRNLLLTCTLFSCLLFTSCQPQPNLEDARRYELKGIVISVDRANRSVVIDHEEVAGFMDAMTMPFTLKDPDALQVLGANDRIQATLVVSDDSSWLENPVITKAASPGENTLPESTSEPRVGAEVPDFALVNQDGKPIRLKQYRGRALLVTFIYTRCPLPEYCTLMSTNFSEISRELRKDSALEEKTHLLSVSIDPSYDTPKILKSYGGAHTGDYKLEKFEHWEFATGDAEEIKRMASYFGLQYSPVKGEIVHSLQTALIAPDGKIHKLYPKNEWKPSQVLSDIKNLLGDHP